MGLKLFLCVTQVYWKGNPASFMPFSIQCIYTVHQMTTRCHNHYRKTVIVVAPALGALIIDVLLKIGVLGDMRIAKYQYWQSVLARRSRELTQGNIDYN